ncbi:MAG: group III truncated hemoglobin [Chitinophagaceae bacterium]|nr:group III truncated hemoglobin [Chitinophagaceae bacterium]
MKNDIASRKDIEILVDEFYSKVKQDEQIGFIFSDIAMVNWEKHLPVMYDFFENMLFYTGSYTGNPMELHKHVNRLFPLTEEHFRQWNHLFSTTVDALFEGTTANLVKQRAKSIAAVMQIKILKESSSADRIF